MEFDFNDILKELEQEGALRTNSKKIAVHTSAAVFPDGNSNKTDVSPIPDTSKKEEDLPVDLTEELDDLSDYEEDLEEDLDDAEDIPDDTNDYSIFGELPELAESIDVLYKTVIAFEGSVSTFSSSLRVLSNIVSKLSNIPETISAAALNKSSNKNESTEDKDKDSDEVMNLLKAALPRNEFMNILPSDLAKGIVPPEPTKQESILPPTPRQRMSVAEMYADRPWAKNLLLGDVAKVPTADDAFRALDGEDQAYIMQKRTELEERMMREAGLPIPGQRKRSTPDSEFDFSIDIPKTNQDI